MLVWLGFLVFYGYAGFTRLIDWKAFAFIEIVRLAAFGAIVASQVRLTDGDLILMTANTTLYATVFGVSYWLGSRKRRAA